MKCVSSLKSKGASRARGNKIVRRKDGKGKWRLYVINPNNPRQKARQ